MDRTLVWYKIFNYIKLPISITVMTVLIAYDYNFSQFMTDKISLTSWFLFVCIAVLYTILLYKMHYKEKDTYFYFIVCLIVDTLLIIWCQPIMNLCMEDYLISFVMVIFIAIIWFGTNCIYINKRKDIFK